MQFWAMAAEYDCGFRKVPTTPIDDVYHKNNHFHKVRIQSSCPHVEIPIFTI